MSARRPCYWECHLCGTYGFSPDPAPRIRAHLAQAHGEPQWTGDPFDHVTPTTVSTDVRDTPRSIFDGTRWGR
jgi:hypothetical protein